MRMWRSQYWKNYNKTNLTCILIFSTRANRFRQSGLVHTKGFSPVCTRKWLTSLYWAPKPFIYRGQPLQLQLFAEPESLKINIWFDQYYQLVVRRPLATEILGLTCRDEFGNVPQTASVVQNRHHRSDVGQRHHHRPWIDPIPIDK